MLSKAFVKYTAYLALLLHEQKSGRDEGDDTRADQIRDEMDQYWHQMTSAEAELVAQISEAVYQIEKAKTT